MDQTDETLRLEILKYTICPICSEFIGSPIYQCSSGHHFCMRCAKRFDDANVRSYDSSGKCPTCRVSLITTGIRCRPLEDILTAIPSIQCSQSGCTHTDSFDKLQEHTDTCVHREVKCPLYDCSWIGKSMDVHSHIERSHTEDIVDMTGPTMCITLYNPHAQRIEIHAEAVIRSTTGKIFVVGFWVIKGTGSTHTPITGTVMYVGNTPPTDLKSRMTFTDQECSTICQRSPWSLSDRLVSIIKSKHNLIIDWDTGLKAGVEVPIYRDGDHLSRHPDPSGMNIPVLIEIVEPDVVCTEDSKVVCIGLDFSSLVEGDI